MISICASGRDEGAQDDPLPFVIDYTPEEPTVGLTGNVASPDPFVVDIPTREPYSVGKVPWTYEGTRDKGKAPTTEDVAAPESSPFPSKKETEEEAEAFMKIVKASEYKVVEQMAKSPAHVSLLALLLGSEPHREALLRGRFSCATTTFPAPASGRTDKGSAALLRSRNTSTGGDSTFTPLVMKSSKPAGATTFTASPHAMGGSTGALQSPRYPTSSSGLHTPSGAPLTALPRTPTTLLPLRHPYAPSLRSFLQGFTFAWRREMRSLTTGPQSRATRL
ncbi:hypothetical protein CRG98_026513 [Punica granatum]|uniref:Uncharacterized protein n=1 Tax=Punica granatum TaxID=22663 RepID=A0A2I0JA19_PUNGR|nr:hypothetical protein CRG98_026513 [Punica granatum]